MNWLAKLIRVVLGHTRYHDQANRVAARQLRAHMLTKQLELIQRGKR